MYEARLISRAQNSASVSFRAGEGIKGVEVRLSLSLAIRRRIDHDEEEESRGWRSSDVDYERK